MLANREMTWTHMKWLDQPHWTYCMTWKRQSGHVFQQKETCKISTVEMREDDEPFSMSNLLSNWADRYWCIYMHILHVHAALISFSIVFGVSHRADFWLGRAKIRHVLPGPVQGLLAEKHPAVKDGSGAIWSPWDGGCVHQKGGSVGIHWVASEANLCLGEAEF